VIVQGLSCKGLEDKVGAGVGTGGGSIYEAGFSDERIVVPT